MRRLLLIGLVACGGSQPVAPSAPAAAEPPAMAVAPAPAPPPAPARPEGHPSQDLIPRAVLFGNPERAAVKISPDGTQLAWLAPKDGVLNVWVAPIGKLDQARPVTSDATRPIRNYTWAMSSRYVMYLQDTGGDENYHVFRVDLRDGKTTDLTPYPGARVAIEKLTPSQPNAVAITSNDRDPKVFDLYKLDVASGKRTLLAQNTDGFADFVLDDQLVPRIAEKKLPDGGTQIVVAAGKAWKPFETIPFEDADSTSVVAVSPDGKAVYMADSRGRDTAALVAVDLATKKPTVIAQDAKADLNADVVFHPTKHTLQAVAIDYLKPTWKVLDPAVEADFATLGKLEGGTIEITSRTTDDKRWIVLSRGDQHAAHYYLWDHAAHKATLLFSAQPKLDEHHLAKMAPLELKARDGMTLVSYLSLPPAADADGDGKPDHALPMVLLVHGGPWGRDDWGFSSIHQLLANRGYAVLSVNFRGSTGLGKKFLNAGNLQWGKAMHDDLIDAVAWAVERGVTTKDRVCIMGGSYGGYATLAGLTLTPDTFRCGVDLFGPSNLLTLLATIPPYWGPIATVFHNRMGDPNTAEGKAILVAASPLTHVAAIKRPLLIGQGANDARVKLAESEQIVAAMKARHLPVSYAVFPDEGHGFGRPENNIAFFGLAEAFLSAHLGGTYQPLSKAELEASSMQIKDGRDGIPGL
ncbi:MAG TPA: S9 family peptidase [Kofleriaceae bacterium]|nr:S9 family peptidase [Kofleriaceae bacterium]